jgi:hypothetical protein
LITLLSSALNNPSVFEKLNGLKPNLKFVGDDAAWVEFVYRRTHDIALKSYLLAHRPIMEYWFDWDITAAYGEAENPHR